MGNAMSWRPPPPHGTVQMVIEPDVCCTCEACCGRQWDESTPKPDFVAMSESRWSEFKTNVGIKVRSYRKENLTAILLAVGILLGIFFLDAGSNFDSELLLREGPSREGARTTGGS